MKLGRDYIKMGWHTCCISLFDVRDPVKRIQALESVAKGELDRCLIPEGKESDDQDQNEEPDEQEDEDEKDVLDIMKERQYGTAKGCLLLLF
jgi:hypothetical protein